MDKVALIQRLSENRALFKQTVSQVSAKAMIAPRETEQPSGKDIIAHLTAWEQRVVRWLKAVAAGETPHSPEPGATWDDMDRLNAQTFEQNKHKSLQEIEATFQRSFEELIAQIQSFTEEELAIPRPFSWVGSGDETEQQPLWQSILAGPCYAHYQDHLYDFLMRTDPARRFIPDVSTMQRCTGTYTHQRIGSLTFRCSDHELWLRLSWQDAEIPGLTLDNTRFAYQDFGLITFSLADDEPAHALEWWTHLFTRV